MAMPPSPEMSSPALESTGSSAQPDTPPESRSWWVERLDSLLSPSLRESPPAELVRHRIMVGATFVLFVFDLLYVLWSLSLGVSPVGGFVVIIGYAATLVLARKSHTPTAPAAVLLLTLCTGLISGLFTSGNDYAGAHASEMVVPALAVYLLKPRQALLITVLLCIAVSGVYPLYVQHHALAMGSRPPADLWFVYAFGTFALLASWGLATLHSTARDSAQSSLERTLKVLRESESRLSSLVESTDDVVLSVDAQGHVLTANATAKQAYQKAFGSKLELGQLLFRPELAGELGEVWATRLAQVLQGQRLRLEEKILTTGANMVMDVSINPILGEDGRTLGLTIFSRDITSRKEAETRLGEIHRTLVDVSRQAGMAEIATGVLHNVGNTLNSVNISTALVTDQLRNSRLNGLAKAMQLLREHATDFDAFLTKDPQGRKLPPYLIKLSEQLQEERESMLKELHALGESVEHIKSIVSMQQKHARAAGAVEEVAVPQLIDEALRLHAVSFERLGIRIDRDYAQVPVVSLDRHQLLQILINLLSNARDSLVASQQPDKHLVIRVRRAPEGERMIIEVEDNGMGIAADHLPRIFAQGFTTKKEGHGFGLHISSLAATEMKGRLSCSSPGPGLGATFALELPLGTSA
ncbi:ATP-binding protein [Hyalangium versicolor]|uniref:ATP-binding protein n=1 Tax=Hyalangium versicolor TaxID=2861190 RepID=UPI001CCEF5AD|nr:ATP-binding protein [Hyalangium versicolor]